MTHLDESLETTAQILARAFILGYCLLILWFGLLLIPNTFLLTLPIGPFDFPPHELALLHYGAIAFFKILLLTFFVAPWISIRLVLRKRRSQSNL